MAEGSDEEHKHPVSPAVANRFTGFSAIPPFHAALQPKWPRGWTGLTEFSDSTPLALSNDTNFFWGNQKSTEKILIVFSVQKPP